jgi:hypothetical protein
MLRPNPRGNYHYLPGSEPYSSGVIADPGYEVVHVTLLRPLPYREGFRRIEEQLRRAGRERQALCAVELRSPKPFTRAGFAEFNEGYRELLTEWNLLLDGENPLARTNVAPIREAPPEPSLYGFSYTAPAEAGLRRTFVVAGAGELRGGPLMEAEVIRPGETSPEARREKAAYVLKAMTRRLEALGVGWGDVTRTEVYTAQPLDPVSAVILDVMGPAVTHAVTWHPSRPPIDELEFEMDVRGVRTELVL